MKYPNYCEGVFLSRPNRFIAKVTIDGREETVHVKNTGRCRELLLPGARVGLVYAKADNPARKTAYDLISVYKEGLGWVNIDSQASNVVVKEYLESDTSLFGQATDGDLLKPEYTYGDSRVDFYLTRSDRRILIEVKGCTLEIDGIGYFPDAPTERGIKHLNELVAAIDDGYETYLAFVIAMPGITEVRPNMVTHPAFGEALAKAKDRGVKVLFLSCAVSPDELVITGCSVAPASPL
ncbi:MAG: DNA/RNA nuclease SfsA [Lachnospiraceae bacterium]|nr:DNA/RNA nuclease SfsA [Lachnospiraceae bacterium]